MPLEIERKFLISDLGFTQKAQKQLITQGYLLSDEQMVFRVRLSGKTATLAIKGRLSDTDRLEYEYPIPPNHAKELISHFCQGRIIEKIRYRLDYKGKIWEVDEFLGANAGLIIAEIELDSSDEEFPHPPWVGEEVTHDARYINSNLVMYPYSRWGVE